MSDAKRDGLGNAGENAGAVRVVGGGAGGLLRWIYDAGQRLRVKWSAAGVLVFIFCVGCALLLVSSFRYETYFVRECDLPERLRPRVAKEDFSAAMADRLPTLPPVGTTVLGDWVGDVVVFDRWTGSVSVRRARR